ncbi:unnamed protein product [Prunus armeniaca]|uniref:Methyltransferase type 11 domain-containing protein n=1 Tax=Prunus armeniaca TaxID=36596 RepID=A0A6J5VGQ8_PRUAR|nr:unnamed protein product [Prunus armeniaca]
MADLFIKQSKQYAKARPDYPKRSLITLPPRPIATTSHGTSAPVTARLPVPSWDLQECHSHRYKPKQLELAIKLPNIRYEHTPAVLSIAEIEQKLAPKSSIDLVIVAQALHWFDLPTFYQGVNWVLKKPNGVIAAWCYTVPRVNNVVDTVFDRFYTVDVDPYWDPQRKLVDNKYRSIDFPFAPVDGEDNTGPFEFMTERLMDLDGFFTYIRSWSAYQTAKEKGVELLSDDVIAAFREAWNDGGDGNKAVKFPVNLRIGRVGN